MFSENNINYAIATCCYGERYYAQANRLIESFEILENKPEIFIVTDSPDSIIKTHYVNIKHISEYNSKYSEYTNDYYNFDHSVKRFSLLHAFENGYNRVILADADVVVNRSLYSNDSIINCFMENYIKGPVTYNFSYEVNTNSLLGNRFVTYEKTFNINFNKSQLNYMPEDCILYIYIDDEKKFKFIKTWDDCITVKNNMNLLNIPAGNIDEICFSALYNNIKVGNNAEISVNRLTAIHDKWYI